MNLEFDLGNPSFTLLHRAGLAGLWMTLKQLEKEKVEAPHNLKYQLSKRQVKLAWEGNDRDFLECFLKESFQLNDGIIALRGLDSQSMREDAQVIVHQGILGTLLQHTSTHKSDGVVTKALSLGEDEDEPEIIVKYKSLKSYVYQEFASNLCDKNGQLFQKLAYERGGLYQVIQKIQSDEREKLFVKACHEAINYTFGKISYLANKRGESPNFDRETVRIRTGLGRCKNSETFREFITDFWSRAGKIPTLQEHWEELMEFVMLDKNWKKSRDLALLALASYKGTGDSKKDKEDSNSEEIDSNTDKNIVDDEIIDIGI
ncbi:MAG: type I-MYXAN CRISPR-associated Cas8a1/Cmx1 [Nostochopsis sp.]